MKAILTVYKDEIKQEQIELDHELSFSKTGEEYLLGRSDENHCFLDDYRVSRKHAGICFKDQHWKIIKKSDYGQLFVNGNPTTDKNLISGDIVSIPPFIINIEILGMHSDKTVDNENDESDTNLLLKETAILVDPYIGNKIGNKSQEGIETKSILQDDDEKEYKPESEGELELDDPNVIEEENFSEGSNEEENFDEEFSVDSDGDSEGDDNQSDEFNSSFGDDTSDNNANESGEFPSLDEGIEDNENISIEENSEDEKTKILGDFIDYELKIFGEHAPYDKFSLKDSMTIIGRDPIECQIALNDTEVSAKHAVLKKSVFGITLEDLQSSNGTILNGSRINESELNNGDEFIIGSTTFTLSVKSELLSQEENRLMPVEENQVIEVEEVVEEEVEYDEGDDHSGEGDSTSTTSNSLFSADTFSNPEKRKKVVYIGFGLVLLIILLSPDGETDKKESKTKTPDENLLNKEGPNQDKKNAIVKKPKKVLTPEEEEFLEQSYQLAKSLFNKGDYREAGYELDKIYQITDEGYKESNQIRKLIEEGFKQLTKLEEEAKKKADEAMRRKEVEELVTRARKEVKEKNVALANRLFSEIIKRDPEQPDVSLMKMEIEAWVREKEKAAVEKAHKESERKRKVNALKPGKLYFQKNDWYRSISKLEEFLRLENMDEDLVEEATEMLKQAKENLNNAIGPLLGKARSLKEGQDLKGAYKNYMEILKIDPSFEESLNEVNFISTTLENKSKKIYREAIISESLSLFEEAKEKFQEVQQISPADSIYYKKSTEKLNNYID